MTALQRQLLSFVRCDVKDVLGRRERLEASEKMLLTAVRVYLDSVGRNVREVAREMGISPQYLCDIRHGRRKVSAEFLKKLHDYATRPDFQ